MKIKISDKIFDQFFKKLNLSSLKKFFFILSLFYFCFYFFNNYDQISFNINSKRSFYKLFFSFLFCSFSIFFNAFAWKNILIWFGKINNKNVVSHYVLTNILKYVPGGIWHFVERFNFIKDTGNPQIAFYSVLIEPYFMLCAAFLFASIGVVFSPLYIFLIFPIFFLNRNLIYFVLRILESAKGKATSALKLSNPNNQFKKKIELNSLFPLRALLFEIGFILSKFVAFIFCLNIINTESETNLLFLFIIFCLSWSIGLIVPTAPGGVGIFESCYLFFVGENIPQNIIIVTLIYFRLISTSSDLILSLPFLIKKFLKKI